MVLYRRPRPRSSLFLFVPILSKTSNVPLFRSTRICPIINCSSKPVMLTSSHKAEEELFIRRHAAKNRNNIPPSSEKNQSNQPQFDYITQSPSTTDSTKPVTPSQISEDNDEQFNFTPAANSDKNSTPTTTSKERIAIVDETQPRPNLLSDPKNDSVTLSKDPATNKQAVPKIEKVSKSNSALRSLAARARMETIRLVVDTRLGSVRLPTRRETVLLAWEIVFVLALLTLLRAGVSSTLRWIHNRLHATRGGSKNNMPYEASVFECMQRPLEFLSLFTVGTALAEAVSRPLAATGLLRHIRTLRELGIIFAATWFLLRWIDRIRSRFALEKRFDKAQVDATSRIATVATFIVSLLIALDTIGINVQTVLAFGGIGGVAIGFAGREIISNFFGGFMIYVTRPFSVGEWIRSIEERELNGTVEDIGWYLTRVRTWDKRPLYIPNSRFSTLIVENGSRMDNRRVLHTLHLRHEDMPVVPDIVKNIESLLMSHPELDPRQHRLAYVDSFDEFSVKIWLSCYTKSVFLYDYRRVQQDILVKCHAIIRASGAKLATRNTRDVRPGVDTDRYGPYGNKATYGKEISGIPTPDTAPNFAPVNNDVPGAPRYGRPNPLISLHTIESGIDPSTLAQHATSANSPSVGAADSETPATVPNGASSSSRSTSAAAVAAAAAALAAARRNARRMEGNENRSEKESILAAENINDQSLTNVESIVNNTPPSGQMKISAAPPIRQTPSSTTGAPGGGGMSSGSGAQGGSSVDATNKGIDSLSTAPEIGNVNDESAQGSGVMKISKAKKPFSLDADNVTSSQNKVPTPKRESPKTENRSSDDHINTSAKTQTNPVGSGDSVNSSSMTNADTIASSGADSGVMKITKARKPLDMEVDSDISSAKGNRSSSSQSNRSSVGPGGSINKDKEDGTSNKVN